MSIERLTPKSDPLDPHYRDWLNLGPEVHEECLRVMEEGFQGLLDESVADALHLLFAELDRPSPEKVALALSMYKHLQAKDASPTYVVPLEQIVQLHKGIEDGYYGRAFTHVHGARSVYSNPRYVGWVLGRSGSIMPHEEMMREWYGKCRTCHYWDGPRQGRGLKWGRCTEPEITGMDKTTHDGHCEGCWEPFDWIAH